LGRRRRGRLEALDELEADVNRVQVPLSYTDELYHLRSHITLVRRELESRMTPPVPGTTGSATERDA